MDHPTNPPLKDSFTTSIKRWDKESELLSDIRALAAKYGVDYDISDYFGEKSSLLSFDESYDLWELNNAKPKYIKQVHQANILANIFVLLFEEIVSKHGINIMESLSVFNEGEEIIIGD